MVSSVALTRYAERMSLPSNRIFASKTLFLFLFPGIFRASAGKLIYALLERLFSRDALESTNWARRSPVCRGNLTARSARFIGRNFLWIISPLRRLFINFFGLNSKVNTIIYYFLQIFGIFSQHLLTKQNENNLSTECGDIDTTILAGAIISCRHRSCAQASAG